jgi:hypothetical protein
MQYSSSGQKQHNQKLNKGEVNEMKNVLGKSMERTFANNYVNEKRR